MAAARSRSGLDRRQLLTAAGLGAGVSATSAQAATPQVRVAAPRVDYLENPLGLDNRKPRFSWTLEAGGARDLRQTAYRLTVATGLEALRAGDPLLWDSGKIASDRSLDIPYEGLPLASGQRCWWRVEAWVQGDRPARPSAPAWWEMGLLDPADWTAGWLEAEPETMRQERLEGVHWVWGETDDAGPRRFRWRFDLPEGVKAARVTVSAKDSLAGLWLDGDSLIRPGDRTAWGQGPSFALPDLSPGPHVLVAEVGLRLDEARPVIGGALAAMLRLTLADGREVRVHAKDGWRTTLDAPQAWQARAHDDSAWPKAVPARIVPPCHPWVTGPAVQLRRAFRLDKPVTRARLYATALGGYEARLNGRKVGDGVLAPESTDFRTRALYRTHDVTGLLRAGDNVLGAIVGDGWFASPFGFLDMRYAFGPPPRRFSALLDVEHTDGTRSRVQTDGEGWRLAPSPVVLSEIYDGETYDARLEQAGWDAPGFDDEGWSAARLGETPPCRLAAHVAPPIRPIQTLKVRKVSEPAPGVRILDFGQNFAGWCRIRVKGPAGATVRLRFAEALRPDGTLNTTSNRRALQTDTYILRGDPAGETFEPRFTFHGFRYVEVTGWPGAFSADAVEGVVLHSDAALTGAARIDHPLIQAIWRNTLWSQRGNFLGVPTDCPQRDERMGWTGDAQIFWDAAAFNMDVGAFTRRFMGDIRAGQSASGEMPDTAPFWTLGQNTPGWADAAVILPWTAWRRYGDTAVIDENWAAMDRWSRRLLETNPDHVWRNGRGMDYGDWLSVDARSRAEITTPKELVSTAYWAWSTDLLAQMAEATGRTADAARLQALRAAIGAAFVREFVRPDGGVGNDSQTSHVLALRFGLVPPALRAASAGRLAADIQRRGVKLSTGFIGTPYILDALADHGHADLAYGLLLQTGLPSWGYQVGQGATTVFERWDGIKDGVVTGSLNHYAFGAVCGFLWRRVIGIDALEPGFKAIAFRPLVDPRLPGAAGTYESAMGRIACAWRRTGDGLAVEVTVPANATGRVHLPALPGATVREGRRTVAPLERTETEAVVQVGSGSYAFTVTA
ncbi:family 78 glycoside hydrolase catalytic domain [Caulobacter sp. BE254]|uniref:alpha-L-rhamnosidase n=1 Tax=Caulobacter sp. BE254 TaxID=2817720 RepID=UPI002858CFF6|nr:family 78 glycoside hydrolase catalytic domain [Caulobacter sp. BE254]MDR7118787.1 alpha-L-rhamnosidase [Caulobacter sp. BE254]